MYDWKNKKENLYIARQGTNISIATYKRREEQYERQATRNKWIKKILELQKKGVSANDIYAQLKLDIKRELGFDPKKMIEHFTKTTIDDNKNDINNEEIGI